MVSVRIAPAISEFVGTPGALGPPNHKMVTVNVAYTVTDTCPGVTCTLGVSSSEPENGTGDGDTAHDWQIINPHQVKLRAERAGNGPGRIYTIPITCTDSGSASSTSTVTVSVPHSH